MIADWYLWESEIPSEEVDKIIEECNVQFTSEAKIGTDDRKIWNEKRRSKVCFIQNKKIEELIWKYIAKANKKVFGFDVENMLEVQFTEYHGESNDFYGWHQDNYFTNGTMYDRKLTFVLMLSDESEYEGGNFEFNLYGDTIPIGGFKRKGSIVAFPSFHTHRVTPVTNGLRRTLVSWASGPSFK